MIERQRKLASRLCPVCSDRSAEVLYSAHFVLAEGHPLGDGYDVVCCDACGFVYADTVVGQRQFDEYYARLSKYEDAKVSTGGGDNPSDRARLAHLARGLATAFPDRSTRFVDIGCATGGLLAALQELGYSNLCGIDAASRCCEQTRRRTGAEAHVGTLSKMPRDVAPADVVTLCAVLEHVHDVRSALGAIRQVLLPNGAIFIEVPDASGYALDVVAPFQDFNTEHINHFSCISLSNLMEQAGFSTISAESCVIQHDGMRVACARGIWKNGETPTRSRLRRDDGLQLAILAYIDKSRALMERIEARLVSALRASDQFVVWGTGQLLMKLLAETSLGKAKIAAFIDGNSINHGKLIRGVPVLAPEAVKDLPYPIVISSTIHQQPIARRIRDDLKVQNPIIMLGDR